MKMLAIIPAYNEEANIEAVVADLRCFPGDLLIVNDGSSDATAAEAKRLGVAIITHPFNLGIGGTVQTGFKYALENGYDLAIQFDGDGQHRGDQVGTILEKVLAQEADLVIGCRTIPGGYRIGATRWIGSRIFLCLIRLLARQTIHDPTSGFRCYGKKTMQLFARHYPDDYPEVESIITAARHGLKVAEVPVLMRRRLSGHSSITRRKSAYYMMKVSLALVMDSVRGKTLWRES